MQVVLSFHFFFLFYIDHSNQVSPSLPSLWKQSKYPCLFLYKFRDHMRNKDSFDQPFLLVASKTAVAERESEATVSHGALIHFEICSNVSQMRL